MILVGLTGGIASGKSTVAAMLVERGAILLDADVIAREIVEPEEPAWKKVVDHFGTEILQADRRIDRDKLARIVFADDAKRALLNEITHPRVMSVIADRPETLKPTDSIVVCDIPLLAESGIGRDMFDLVLVVHAGPATQMDRLGRRRGMTPADAQARIAAQASPEERMAFADVVVDNDGDRDALAPQIDALWSDLEKRLAAASR